MIDKNSTFRTLSRAYPGNAYLSTLLLQGHVQPPPAVPALTLPGSLTGAVPPTLLFTAFIHCIWYYTPETGLLSTVFPHFSLTESSPESILLKERRRFCEK